MKTVPLLNRVAVGLRYRVRMITNLDWKGALSWLFGAIVASLISCAIFTVLQEDAPGLHDYVRWSGIALQVLGLGIVVWGLMLSREQFGEPALRKSVSNWLRRFFRGRQTHSGSVNLKGAGQVSVEGKVEVSKISASLEDRLNAVEKELRTLQRTITVDIAELRNELHGITALERNARQQQGKDLAEKLKTAVIGGIRLEVAGVAYLFLGILFASAPMETARTLEHLWVVLAQVITN